MPRFNYIVPGIFDSVNDPRMWDYQAQAWLHMHAFGMAAGFNYFADVIGATQQLDKQAAMIASDLRRARALGGATGLVPIVCVGHSNGCRLLVEALKNFRDVWVDELHLIAAAVDHDAEENGLNAIARASQIGRLRLYVSPDDEVLALPGAYGDLGRVGLVNACPTLARITETLRRHCGHSDWVGRDFESTMEAIVRPFSGVTA